MATISLENVSYIYGAKTPFEIEALDCVNLTVREGSVTGIIGHTGSGKSTLVQLLNGLEKPTSGRVLLDGKDIWENPKDMQKIRFRVGLVMQYPEYQLFEETIAADIAFGPAIWGLTRKRFSAVSAKLPNLWGLKMRFLASLPSIFRADRSAVPQSQALWQCAPRFLSLTSLLRVLIRAAEISFSTVSAITASKRALLF